jgi:hypothetical protein
MRSAFLSSLAVSAALPNTATETHCRIEKTHQIGRNKPKRERKPNKATSPANGRPFDDALPF